jgi:hypothetical protein
MGQRFCKTFGAPFQGIFNTSTYLKAARNLEDKIRHLRDLVESVQNTKNDTWEYEYIITYKVSLASYVDIAKKEAGSFATRFEYATVLPETQASTYLEATSDTKRNHQRWLDFGPKDALDIAEWEAAKARMDQVKNSGEEFQFFHTSKPVFKRHTKTGATRDDRTHVDVRPDVVIIKHDTRREARSRAQLGFDKDFVEMAVRPGRSIVFDLLIGDMKSIALLQRRRREVIVEMGGRPSHTVQKLMTFNQNQNLAIQRIMQLFHQDSVDLSYCSKELEMAASYNITLLAMTFVKDLYDSMKYATIDVRAVQLDFTEALWVDALVRRLRTQGPNIVQVHSGPTNLSVSDADSAICFACIAMMETGSYNIDPRGLQNVFAIGAADSLYVASILLQDPASKNLAPIKRFTGNIGSAGIAFVGLT